MNVEQFGYGYAMECGSHAAAQSNTGMDQAEPPVVRV